MHKWITPTGGPVVIVPIRHLSVWLGACRSFHSSDTSVTDYEQACDIGDLIGILPIRTTNIIVLNDEPLMTTWFGRPNGGLIVRWCYAENMESVLRYISKAPDDGFQDPAMEFLAEHTPLALFDATQAGSQLSTNDYLLIGLQPGRYLIKTRLFEPDNNTRLVLHRIQRASGIE